ncbi:MAG TPA: UbiH/UbiF/VisC/COQ6 family ubiquinone biosynthesis hydroxylase [Mariprofundaceae bacterium]|nr:UbiH/UbiF/VisC/COQ6 family ubiquinone biosynthesis hydroxylase [Mariprofundaceae bacterium]
MTTARAQAWDADVIIVGGGMVGLALAAALKNTPFSVLVMERAFAEPRLSLGRDMRVSALVAGTANMLAGIGVWPYLEHQAGPIRAMRVWDDQEDGGIRFEAGEIGEEALGYIVENSVLVEALHRTLADAENVHLECPVEVAGANWLEDHAELKLADGRVLRTPLLVGADGGRSWLREQASIHEYGHPYHQKGIVATVKTRLPHRQTAYQRFMPTGPLAFLPLTDNLISIVWSAEDHEAERLMALSEKQFADELYLAFGPLLGDIEAVGERGAFPLRLNLSAHMARERLALIGDAAHQIHPLAGLGVNLGLRDAMVLAQQLMDARRFGEDWGQMDVLSRFMKQRMPDILSVMGAMDGFHYLFTSQLPGLAKLRGLGMRLVGNSGPLKRMLMRNSTGLTLPVPKQIS